MEAFQFLILYQMLTVQWIPIKSISISNYWYGDALMGTYYITIEMTAVTIVVLRIKIMIVIVARAGWTWVSGWHCTSWWWKRTFDILQSTLLFRNWNLKRSINSIRILNGCWFAGWRIMLSILVHQIFKLYSNICTWETQRASENWSVK